LHPAVIHFFGEISWFIGVIIIIVVLVIADIIIA